MRRLLEEIRQRWPRVATTVVIESAIGLKPGIVFTASSRAIIALAAEATAIIGSAESETAVIE